MSGILFIISAPSGSGKSTLVNRLLEDVPNLEFSVSYTTRPRRGSEQDGRHYHFVSRDEFEAMIHAGEFLEHAEVFGYYYGTAARLLREAAARGCDLLLDIDVQGAAQVKSRAADSASIFILPPTRDELEARLVKRSRSENISTEVIQRRLGEAAKEIENWWKYDYILVNNRLENSLDELEAIIASERLKRSGRPLTPEEQVLAEKAEGCRVGNSREKVRPILESFNVPVQAE